MTTTLQRLSLEADSDPKSNAAFEVWFMQQGFPGRDKMAAAYAWCEARGRSLIHAARLAEEAGCRCAELRDAKHGPAPGALCAWCRKPEGEHGDPDPAVNMWRPCSPGASSYYTSSGPWILLEHSPACPIALERRIRAAQEGERNA